MQSNFKPDPTPGHGADGTARRNSFPLQWLGHRLLEKSTWSGASLVVICLLVLLGLPIVKFAAWLGLAYGLYSMLSPG